MPESKIHYINVIYAIIISFWFFYFFLHSFLADAKVKHYIYHKIRGIEKWYRLIYNIIAMTGLLAMVYLSSQITDQVFQAGLLTSVLGWLMVGAGGFIMFLSARTFDLPEFIGIKPFRNQQVGASDSGLIHTGLYAYVRHPLYSGTLLFTLGWFLVYPIEAIAVFLVCMMVYLPVGIFYEEKKLLKEFGDDYRNYCKRVSRLIPGIY